MFMTWAGFLISLASILILSRKNLGLALIGGAIILGLMTLPPINVLQRIIFTVTTPSVLLLALAMGTIPLLGGTMKQSGQIDALVNNIRLNKRFLLPFAAALMGLLPMPGGALLSAPILERGGSGVSDSLKATINNWFRHLFILVYPLNPALIVAAQICNLDVYRTLVYLVPVLLLSLLLGYIFYLRQVHGRPAYTGTFSWRALVVPLLVILAAPLLDFGLKRLFGWGAVATVIGVVSGLTLSVVFSRKRLNLPVIIKETKPWNFGLIILGMFLYLHIFEVSEARNLLVGLPLPPLILAVVAGFSLGIVTGRVQLPASIIFPVYLATVEQVDLTVFALIYTAVYFGYIISPVHPCLVVTCEYFGVPLAKIIKSLAWPTLLVFVSVLLVAVYLS
jgi:integral membrane protein (TIGR00529 family)